MTGKGQYQPVAYGCVTITDAYCKNAYRRECAYLKKLEPDRLLCGFRETAGLAGKAKRYAGWEETEIQGHTLGHYLSALAQAYAYGGDEEFRERIAYICRELKECQRADGYLFASASDLFDRVEKKQPAWVPWYTMHKIFEGLLLAYELAADATALDVAKKLGDWVCARTGGWSAETQQAVLSVEYGGMNDCLYDLYRITGDLRYAEAAHCFDEEPLFDALRSRRDILDGLHANTTIPKVLGALNRYCTLDGMEDYLAVAENFWDIVTEHHTYITGGNSEWEHFGKPDALDFERTACNCETCNTYNMLKLSDRLFRVTGKKKYADFYERTWLNAILSSQNPESGMTTYFQPMATGYFKVYSTPFDKFWCCTGTGMENFTKLCEGIYYEKGSALYINRYVSSELDWKTCGAKLSVTADFPQSDRMEIAIDGNPSAQAELYIRIPHWCAGRPQISVNGQAPDKGAFAREENGYLALGALQPSMRIQVRFGMEVACHALQDNENAVAFTYGPVVLSAKMGTKQMETTVTGVDVTVPKKDFDVKDYLVLQEAPAQWKADIKKHLVKKDGAAEFALRGTDEDDTLVFAPHFKQHTERYGIYFTLYEKDSAALRVALESRKKKQALQEQAGDIIPVGNDQYELAHKVRGEETEMSMYAGRRCRLIKKGGWLSYEMEKESDADMLCAVYHKKGSGTEPEVYFNGAPAAAAEAGTEDGEGFYTVRYPLAGAGTPEGNARFEVAFRCGGQGLCRVFDDIYIVS